MRPEGATKMAPKQACLKFKRMKKEHNANEYIHKDAESAHGAFWPTENSVMLENQVYHLMEGYENV